jgi:hypothetical protein
MAKPEIADLPGLLAELARAEGRETAIAFAERFGGQELSVPVRAQPHHRIAKAFGERVLAWLVGRHGGEKIVVPLGPTSAAKRQRAAIDRLIGEGRTNNQIVQALHVTWRTVQRRRAARGADRRQLDLFVGPVSGPG